MELLTPFQQQVLRAIGRSPLSRDFYLTGGTALAAFYLRHRYSVDLDFFTADPLAVLRVPAAVQDIAQQVHAQVTFTRTLDTFLECFLQGITGERVEMDFAQDSPFRLEPTRLEESYSVQVDNLTDIACNKLSALFDRAEPKDFVDVYFVAQEVFSLPRLIELTRQKHLGLDNYWLAIAFRRVVNVALLPRMIKPVSIDEIKTFFLERAKELMDEAAGTK
ncbi:MAG: nucleotidyl transferase AbiEii/AbiGii toxin family protein [Chloroflexota bacterium]